MKRIFVIIAIFWLVANGVEAKVFQTPGGAIADVARPPPPALPASQVNPTVTKEKFVPIGVKLNKNKK